jgi:excisionase family DNA binding protein
MQHSPCINQRLASSPEEAEPRHGVYTIEDAGQRLGGVGRTTIYGLIASGQLEARKLGSRTLITAASIEALLARLPQSRSSAEGGGAMRSSLLPAPIEAHHLHQNHLARRWCMSPRTLERWRCEGKGPQYLKIGGRILYRLEDIEAFESAHWRSI